MSRLQSQLRTHLKRLTVASVLIALAAVPFVFQTNEWMRSFAVMAIGWSAVNLIIVAASGRSQKPPEPRSFRDFLALNLGLNLGYIGVGIALWSSSPHPGVQGSGAAVTLHGMLLEVLDGWLWREIASESQDSSDPGEVVPAAGLGPTGRPEDPGD